MLPVQVRIVSWHASQQRIKKLFQYGKKEANKITHKATSVLEDFCFSFHKYPIDLRRVFILFMFHTPSLYYILHGTTGSVLYLCKYKWICTSKSDRDFCLSCPSTQYQVLSLDSIPATGTSTRYSNTVCRLLPQYDLRLLIFSRGPSSPADTSLLSSIQQEFQLQNSNFMNIISKLISFYKKILVILVYFIWEMF
jgi:hypothetical protein